jgi:hypothetical protein
MAVSHFSLAGPMLRLTGAAAGGKKYGATCPCWSTATCGCQRSMPRMIACTSGWVLAITSRFMSNR